MGLATATTIGTGIMGIGYNTSEANVDTGNGTEYPNLPLAMVNQGVINSAAYSLWLNDLRKFSFYFIFYICSGEFLILLQRQLLALFCLVVLILPDTPEI